MSRDSIRYCRWPTSSRSLHSSTHRSWDADSRWSCFWRLPSLLPRFPLIGVYSVLAYLVSQRTKEIGLRLAIGASPSGVVWLFVREGMAPDGGWADRGSGRRTGSGPMDSFAPVRCHARRPDDLRGCRVRIDRGGCAGDIRTRATSGECRPNRRVEDRLAQDLPKNASDLVEDCPIPISNRRNLNTGPRQV